MDFEALATKCEAANGPDDEIDEAIMAALFVRDERHIGTTDADTDEPLTDKVWVDPATNRWVSTHAREFTHSVDAALSLLPKDHWWEVIQLHAPDSPMKNFGSRSGMFRARTAKSYGVNGATGGSDYPAIAICAAALRARAAMTAEPGSQVPEYDR